MDSYTFITPQTPVPGFQQVAAIQAFSSPWKTLFVHKILLQMGELLPFSPLSFYECSFLFYQPVGMLVCLDINGNIYTIVHQLYRTCDLFKKMKPQHVYLIEVLFCYYKQICPHILVIKHLGPDRTAMLNIYSFSGKNISKLCCLFSEFVGFTLMCLQSGRRTHRGHNENPLKPEFWVYRHISGNQRHCCPAGKQATARH